MTLSKLQLSKLKNSSPGQFLASSNYRADIIVGSCAPVFNKKRR